ncbi:hypothetical protein [Denitromonas sp.]|uniref:hypothetical protein n=1 Tax=Denitromonas sp. TaxID=2734609 RepID=UPI001D956A40|nr:hypothetical protein [Rhodocyclaceae bacterium]
MTTLASDEYVLLASGRSLLLSPAWPDDDASVLFDRNSGDYWVVTASARALVDRLINAEQPMRLSQLDVDGVDAATKLRLTEELSALGILAMG